MDGVIEKIQGSGPASPDNSAEEDHLGIDHSIPLSDHVAIDVSICMPVLILFNHVDLAAHSPFNPVVADNRAPAPVFDVVAVGMKLTESVELNPYSLGTEIDIVPQWSPLKSPLS